MCIEFSSVQSDWQTASRRSIVFVVGHSGRYSRERYYKIDARHAGRIADVRKSGDKFLARERSPPPEHGDVENPAFVDTNLVLFNALNGIHDFNDIKDELKLINRNSILLSHV